MDNDCIATEIQKVKKYTKAPIPLKYILGKCRIYISISEDKET